MIRGQRVTIRVVFSARMVPYIRERLWHPTQELKRLPDGRLEMTLKVAALPDIRRWLLGFGPDAALVAPGALREGLRLRADALIDTLTLSRRPLKRSPLPPGPQSPTKWHQMPMGSTAGTQQ